MIVRLILLVAILVFAGCRDEAPAPRYPPGSALLVKTPSGPVPVPCDEGIDYFRFGIDRTGQYVCKGSDRTTRWTATEVVGVQTPR